MKNPPGDLARRHRRLDLLYQVSKVIHSTLEPNEALKLILRETVRLTRATSGSIALINPNTQFLEIQVSRGLPAHASQLRLRVGEGITGWVARTGQPARVGNVAADPRYFMLRKRVRSELAVPLEVNGEIRGVINVDSTRLDAFQEEDQALLEELALQASEVIRNTWVYEQLRLKARLFEALFSVGQAINSTLSLDDALRVITREGCQLMSAKMCALLMLDPSREWLELRAHYGAGSDYVNKPRLSVDESLLGIVVRRGKPLQVENVQLSSRYQSVEVARREGLVSLLSVPLSFAGQVLGTLSVYSGEPHNFSNEEIRILSALAELSGIALEKARLYERIMEVEEELRQNEKLSALGLLAAEVAHEIRNPLTVMKMLYHSLDLKFPPGDPRIKDFQVMGSKMDHLNKIVEQALDFARTTEPKFTPTNVNQLMSDMGLLIRHKLHQQNVELVQKLDPLLPLVSADSTLLEQAFLNLALNAVEAMPKGGRLTIVSRPTRGSGEKPGHVLVEFKDTGVGISPERREQIFSSLLASTKTKGTGLGLAIVSRVVEAHRGKIAVTSRPGRGSTFQVFLPI